jgi:small subunit ribosomal protein S1
VEVTEEKVTSTAETPEKASQEAETKTVSQMETEPAPQNAAESESPDRRIAGQKKVVKKLAVGQQLRGKIKRVADFGAFVDIGVGRDGLVHISELSYNRVNKVSDVVSEGQEVDVWIKELDRERNRISLTMRKPPEVDIITLQPDQIIEGTVSRIVAYGAFVDIGTGREALLHVREMAEGYVKNPGDVVSVGGKVTAKVIKVDPKTRQVDLSIKDLLPREEREPQPSRGARGAVVEPEEPEMLEEEEEPVPTAMELALKEALAMEGKEPRWVTRRRQERRKKEATRRREQDDILSRTLSMHKKWEDVE